MEKDTCSFCGVETRSAVVWLSRTPVVCCRQCAENVLPMMIGDSLHLVEGTPPFHEAERQWNGRFKVRFLRAIMARCVVRKARD